MSDLQGYGEFIKQHRLNSGYKSQRQLADAAGISSATLSRIESEIQKPQMETIQVLSRFLHSTNLAGLMDVCGYFDGLEGENKDSVLKFFTTHESLDKSLESSVIKIIGLGNQAIEQMTMVIEKYFKNEIQEYKDELNKDVSYTFAGINEFLRFFDPPVQIKDKLNEKLEKIADKFSYKTLKSELTPQNSFVELVQIPIYGEIAAGYNVLVQENIIGYDYVDKATVRDGSYFYLIVKGESMIDEGIRPGMKVLVKSQNSCEHGKIGVVLVNGDEATLKRVFYNEDTVILQAANRDIPPRILPIHEVRIQGQVRKVEFDV